MNILEILKRDYQHFPADQTFEIYADNVFFKDPLNEFRGVTRYRKMIAFLDRWFQHIQLDLHHIDRHGQTIRTDWTLHMTCPVPWRSRLCIQGYSLLELNDDHLIISHVDHWHHSIFEVLGQLLTMSKD